MCNRMTGMSFGSDNHAGVHPAVLEAIRAVSGGFAPAYGEDPYTRSVLDRLVARFGGAPYLVETGTQANVLCLACLVKPHQAIVCAETAHIAVDECGAVERFTGAKLLPVATPDGKLRPADVAPFLRARGTVHHSQPACVSVSQPTERGTLYHPEELAALAAFCRTEGLSLHVDGARLSNAAVVLGLDLPEAAPGADALSLGFTKNGALAAECAILFRPAAAADAPYVRKQQGSLLSKQRYLAAQVAAMLDGDLWRANALAANAAARRLADRLAGLPGLRLTSPVETNALFAVLPRPAIDRLLERWTFYVWDEARDECRWMTSFATPPEAVDAFAADIAGSLEGTGAPPRA